MLSYCSDILFSVVFTGIVLIIDVGREKEECCCLSKKSQHESVAQQVSWRVHQKAKPDADIGQKDFGIVRV